MNPSASSVSDLLNALREHRIEVNECLLIGEKVDLIHAGGEIYNKLRSMVTPEYFLDDEYVWLKALGNNWNKEVQSYHASMGGCLNDFEEDALQDLTDEIQRHLDELNGDMDG